MEFVATLIAAPSETCLTSHVLADARRAMDALGADTTAPNILGMHPESDHIEAADIFFEGINPEAANSAIRAVLGGSPIDCITTETANRKKKILVADMDSTMVIGETLDELADFANLKDKIAAITARAMNGELDFEAALKERVGMLAGLKEDALQKTYDALHLMPGSQELVATMRANGAYTVLVSGGFDFFTRRVAAALHFHEDVSNRLEIIDGALTGQVIMPIVDRSTKLATLKDRAKRHSLSLNDAITVGDGANDLDMLKAASLGIAYHAKPAVAAEATNRVQYGSLVALLFAQGYTRADFITAP
jgi:phosphoserine phosphatase